MIFCKSYRTTCSIRECKSILQLDRRFVHVFFLGCLKSFVVQIDIPFHNMRILDKCLARVIQYPFIKSIVRNNKLVMPISMDFKSLFSVVIKYFICRVDFPYPVHDVEQVVCNFVHSLHKVNSRKVRCFPLYKRFFAKKVCVFDKCRAVPCFTIHLT